MTTNTVVRPKKVLAAVQYLVRNSEIFENEGIQVMDEWSEFISKDMKETSQNLSNDLNTQRVENAETETHHDTIDNDTDR